MNGDKNTQKVFIKNGFNEGRMIGGSKSMYRGSHPDNIIVFNANIFVKTGELWEKIWYGDLDLTIDYENLKKISKEINKKIYVLSEMDGRFGNENNQSIIENSVWDSDITKKPIQKRKKNTEDCPAKKEPKKNLKIEKQTEIAGKKIVEVIPLPFKKLKSSLKKLKKKIKSFNLESEDGFEDFWEWKEENLWEYLATTIIANYIKKTTNNNDVDEIVNVSNMWVRDKDYSSLKKYDETVLSLIEFPEENETKEDEKYRKNKISEQISWHYFNSGPSSLIKDYIELNGISINSFEKGKIYLTENFIIKREPNK